MYEDTDTKAIKYENTPPTPAKKEFDPRLFFWFMMGMLAAAVLFLGLSLLKDARQKRLRDSGVVSAKYVGDVKSLLLDTEKVTPPKPPSKQVIFRLGDEEIFRFTYEGGGDGRRCSFEIREGGS